MTQEDKAARKAEPDTVPDEKWDWAKPIESAWQRHIHLANMDPAAPGTKAARDVFFAGAETALQWARLPRTKRTREILDAADAERLRWLEDLLSRLAAEEASCSLH